jgi:hypothetical protein
MNNFLKELVTRFMLFIVGLFLAFIGFLVLEYIILSIRNKDYFVFIILFLPIYVVNFICSIFTFAFSIFLIAISLDPRERFH